MINFVAADGYFAIYTEMGRTGRVGPDDQPVLRNVIGWGATQCCECKKSTIAAYVIYPYENRLVRADELEGFISLIGPNPQSDHKAGATRLLAEAAGLRAASKPPKDSSEKRYLRIQARSVEAINEE